MKKIFLLLNFVVINLNAAESKALTRVNPTTISPEVKIAQEQFLQAAHFYGSNDIDKLNKLDAVRELLSQALPVQNRQNGQRIDNMPMLNLIFEYTQSDFAFQAKWDIDKIPISQTFPNGDFLTLGSWIISFKIENHQIHFFQRYKAHEAVFTYFYLKDGRLVTYSADRTIKIWQNNKDYFDLQFVLHGHEWSITHVIELNDGTLASASDDKTIRIWHEDNNKFVCKKILRNQQKEILSLLQVNKNLISASRDNSLCLWQKENNQWKVKNKYENAHNSKGNILLKIDGPFFINRNDQDKLQIWQVNDDTLNLYEIKEIQNLTAHNYHSPYLITQNLNEYTLYQQIDGKFEFFIKFHGHVTKNGLPGKLEISIFSKERLYLLTSEQEDGNMNSYYISIWQKDYRNNWTKKVIYLGIFKKLSLDQVIYDKIIFSSDDSVLLVLGKCDLDETGYKTDYISGTLYDQNKIL